MGFEPAASKADALRRFEVLLGVRLPLGVGSSVPSTLFSAATDVADLPDEGSMPLRAKAVVEAAGLVWDEECDSRHTDSGGGSTVTLTGLNRLLEAVERLTAWRAP